MAFALSAEGNLIFTYPFPGITIIATRKGQPAPERTEKDFEKPFGACPPPLPWAKVTALGFHCAGDPARMRKSPACSPPGR